MRSAYDQRHIVLQNKFIFSWDLVFKVAPAFYLLAVLCQLIPLTDPDELAQDARNSVENDATFVKSRLPATIRFLSGINSGSIGKFTDRQSKKRRLANKTAVISRHCPKEKFPMNYEPGSSDEPKIVGFESSPLPSSNATDLKTLGMIAAVVLGAVFLFCQVTGTSFNHKVTSPHTNQKNKYVRKPSSQSYRSAEEATRAVNQSFQETMQRNSDMLESFNESMRKNQGLIDSIGRN